MNVVLLPLGVPYQLDQLANNQPKLSDFFASKSNHVSKDASITAVYEAKAQTDDSSLNDGRSKNAGLSEPDESMEHERPIRVEIENPVLDNTKEKMIDQKSCGAGKSCEINMAEPTSSDIENESSVKNEHKSSTFQPYNSVISYCFDDNSTLGSTSSTAGAPSRKRHSTLGDPNFVENYFKVVK